MKYYWIYKITNIANGKVYIGSSLNVKQRKSNHFKELLNNTHYCQHLQRAYNTYGRGSFLFDIIEVGEYNFTYSELLLKEDVWVLFYDSLNIEKGYNKVLPSSQKDLEYSFKQSKIGYENYLLTHGPHGLTSMSKEEWIEKRKSNSSFSLRNESIERGKSLIRANKVYAINIKTNLLTVFNSQKECEDVLSIDSEGIRKTLKHNITGCSFHKIRKGCLLLRESEYFIDIVYKPLKGSKPKVVKEKVVLQKILPIIKIQNIDTLEIKEFNYYKDVSIFLNVNYSNVIALKKGTCNKGNGRIVNVHHCKRWKFIV